MSHDSEDYLVKPCPFCGAEMLTDRAGKTISHDGNIPCFLNTCRFSDDVLPMWNRRVNRVYATPLEILTQMADQLIPEVKK